jgi:hypothetical protein
LMALCDRLEVSLSDTATNRRRLLDAILAEALAPRVKELEAAERTSAVSPIVTSITLAGSNPNAVWAARFSN